MERRSPYVLIGAAMILFIAAVAGFVIWKLRAGDRTLFFLTMILTVASNLTIAIGVGTFVGLALRLSRREVEPKEWSPVDRSKL